ncbi:p25-alpha-domain-containing protein [Scenedesmus sp. NREL 46B-D3]|nr:p25-alpha-domain-containing protein [Scenedesmus sp. NREL 46B-D3]
MACNERMKEEFDTLHEAVLEMLKGEALTTMPDGRLLPAANYRDAVRPLRRMLKQMGRGCLTAGVSSLHGSEASQAEVARLLEVPAELLAEEVAQVPESDLDLDMLYHKLMQPAGQLQALLNQQHCSITPEISSSALDGASSSREGSCGSSTTPAGLYADLFKWYDRNKSGAIEQDELQAVLSDLGMLEGKGAGEVALFTANHMRVADAAAAAAGTGLGCEAFCKLYDTLVMNKARQQLRFKLGLRAEDDLKATFVSFASFGTREPVEVMDGAHFQKMCRDCGLLGRHLSTTDVDLIFAKVKTKGARKITFEQCLTALAAISEKKVLAFEDTVAQVLEAGGPIAHATKADNVRLHDDKSLYTGVYARGGAATVEPQFDLLTYLDRSAGTDARGLKKSAAPKSARKAVPLEGDAKPAKSAAAASAAGSARTSCAGGASPASSSRRASTHGGGAPLRSSSLKDVLKEAFAGLRIKGKGDKGSSPRCKSSGQAQHGTTPVKHQVTPSRAGVLTDSRRMSSAGGSDASLKDVFSAFAGFGIHTPTRSKAAEPVFHTNTATPTTVRRVSSTAGSAAGGRPAAPGMDGFRFVKLCREAGLIDGRFSTTSADLVFAKVKTQGAKKISFAQFNEALALIAADKGISTADAAAAIKDCGGPAYNTGLHATNRLRQCQHADGDARHNALPGCGSTQPPVGWRQQLRLPVALAVRCLGMRG